MENFVSKQKKMWFSTLFISILSFVFVSIYLVNVIYSSVQDDIINEEKYVIIDQINFISKQIRGMEDDCLNHIFEENLSKEKMDNFLSNELFEVESNVTTNKFVSLVKHLEKDHIRTNSDLLILRNGYINYLKSMKMFTLSTFSITQYQSHQSVRNELDGLLDNLLESINSQIRSIYHSTLQFTIMTTVIGIVASLMIIGLSVHFDLKKRKYETFLKQKNHMMDLLTNNMQQGIMLFNRKTKKNEYETKSVIKYRNSLCGGYLNNLSEKDRDFFIHKLNDETFNEIINYEFQIVTENESRWFTVNLFPITSHNEITHILLFITDFTNIKEYNKNLLSALNEAKNATRSKQLFLSNISHEIRTPLTTILGLTELSLVGKEFEMRGFLEEINTASNHLLSLINDFLTMSRMEEGKVEIRNEPFHFKKVIKDLEIIIIPLMKKKNIDFILPQETSDSFYVGDASKIKQVLINLISNSIKYTPCFGQISLFISEKENKDISYFSFVIQDTGIGMSEEYIQKLFKPFERENPEDGMGTGLGLSITKSIVTLMDGTIRFESKKGIGTKVFITLPFSKCLSNKKDEINYDFSSLSILVAEDNLVNQNIIKRFIELKNGKVEVVDNGKKVIQKVKHNHFDLILMDVQMPIMDGTNATKEIRKFNSTIPIIALSADCFPENISLTKEAGMNDFLCKPISMNHLYEKLYVFQKK